MIERDEIDAAALTFGIRQANVQRDYVFGWLLAGIFSNDYLRERLVFKGGNCFRKAYFPNARFSNDLDFSTQSTVDVERTRMEFNQVCAFVQQHTDVKFEPDKSRVELQSELDQKRRVFDVRVYFKDFYGHADHISISISIDITELDRIYLAVQERGIIHPYSDASELTGSVRCLKLEEMLANKLKCLLQRQHVPDLYDLVYSIFINRDVEVNRSEVLGTFFRKTIYERSPGTARQLLLGLPLKALGAAWNRYIIAPVQGMFAFDEALVQFETIINGLFEGHIRDGYGTLAFFPSHLRNPIMQAGGDRRLMRLTYDGVERTVEPYSLVYKRRQDGHGEEYFYVWDRTGGRSSGPGVKTLLSSKIASVEVLEERFEPRYPIELAKAGEFSGRSYFGKSFGLARTSRRRPRPLSSLRHGWVYTVECSFCSRRFKRMRRDTALKPHKNSYGGSCSGRRGTIVDQQLR
jgi:predicted nucleotidyltransferase component of viral defense system